MILELTNYLHSVSIKDAIPLWYRYDSVVSKTVSHSGLLCNLEIKKTY
jgi:hypothetical protein